MIWLTILGCTEFQSWVVSVWPIEYTTPVVEAGTTRPEITVQPVLKGLPQLTDVAFFSDNPSSALITLKEGDLVLADVSKGTTTTVHSFNVRTASEQGLLSVALHPKYHENSKVYLHRTPKIGKARTEIGEYTFNWSTRELIKLRVLFEIEQPYPNHNGGAIRFGDDGHLYVGLGDGGWRNDPKANGQNFSTPLGGILRFNVDGDNIIPTDNPFVDDATVHDALWLTGLRNPWKFSVLPDGDIIVADVGQNAWEEVSLAQKGDNLGWNVWEGNACVQEPCEKRDSMGEPFVFPVHTYAHSEGQSITGGMVLSANNEHNGKYIFGDFLTGKVWVLSNWDAKPHVELLKQLELNISTFAQDPLGTAYVSDFGSGTLYRFEFSQ